MARKIEQIQQENIAIQKELDALKALTEREEKEKKKSELDLRIQHAKKEVSSQYQAETDQNMREKIKAEENKLESFSTELGALGAEVLKKKFRKQKKIRLLLLKIHEPGSK